MPDLQESSAAAALKGEPHPQRQIRRSQCRIAFGGVKSLRQAFAAGATLGRRLTQTKIGTAANSANMQKMIVPASVWS